MNIKNELGDFYSEKMQVTSDQYMELVEVSKKFYIEEAGFEMWLENGFMVMSSDMARRSILSINILEYDKEENDKQTNNEDKI
jgi:hypothetical protein